SRRGRGSASASVFLLVGVDRADQPGLPGGVPGDGPVDLVEVGRLLDVEVDSGLHGRGDQLDGAGEGESAVSVHHTSSPSRAGGAARRRAERSPRRISSALAQPVETMSPTWVRRAHAITPSPAGKLTVPRTGTSSPSVSGSVGRKLI